MPSLKSVFLGMGPVCADLEPPLDRLTGHGRPATQLSRIGVYTVYQGNSTNTCTKALLKSSTVAKAGLPVAIERPRTSYTCSSGSRSGDIADHSNP
ncbi:hypothetical protein TNCV_2496851 [Trichonephila clavipes]|nr:hypothetical protein TNCV_2496851 [Trichonephila clavipes]